MLDLTVVYKPTTALPLLDLLLVYLMVWMKVRVLMMRLWLLLLLVLCCLLLLECARNLDVVLLLQLPIERGRGEAQR